MLRSRNDGPCAANIGWFRNSRSGVAELVRERGEDLVGEIAEILGGAVC
jgi:hypothetical protein